MVLSGLEDFSFFFGGGEGVSLNLGRQLVFHSSNEVSI